ncbi:hypothetical protein BJ508DRAFT_319836 [Ascobolus immersus RN42]|uniref:Pectate lyase n=1 Tax=Ascobolus immersus RN42 TaxID=1160509 RepID=A0A3N4HK91_ASCIM|nr:hypothetical protein BJ508DRAFT_319836 [Ascobolus immersus RN42]
MVKISISATFLALALSVSAQVPAWGQCGGNGYSGSTSCVSGYKCQYVNDWYSQCVEGAASSSTAKPTSTTTSKATTTSSSNGGGSAGSTNLSTVFPAAAGTTLAASAITIKSGQSLDGKMMRYDRNSKVCADQTETGEKDAMFILEDGATISNVIIGPNQAEGIHCKGNCVINNVWWEDVCEDAATFKAASGTSYVNGGGARKASDKVFQHNGFGTVAIKNFYVEDYGKLYRSCGNCSGNGKARTVTIDNVVAKNGGILAGINTNYGDKVTISNTCQNSGKWCDLFKGTTSGEPSKLSSGPDGKSCIAINTRTSC